MDSNSRQFDTMFVIYMPIRYMGSKLWHILTKMLPIMLKYELFDRDFDHTSGFFGP